MASGVTWLTFLYPPLGYQVFPFIALPGLIASAATVFWLLAFGINEKLWMERARPAGPAR
jgi:hypothetical protein